MTNEEAIEVLDDMKAVTDIPKSAVTQLKRNKALNMAIEALEKQKNSGWIKVRFRNPTEEENECFRAYWGCDACYWADCEMPEDGQEILIATKYGTSADICKRDAGFELDSGTDWEDVISWMPMPKYEEEGEET